ncbi:LysE/ArgO family amino acid transporter [Microbacterium sp. SSW1-59]|uniref:LysE/ArgO family amino acid transporter n=1 Tax=Microbacterium xanthum TaxID=3079794 RepID=UPI002AD57AD1|nr:LysE/ArgO family amino acid transporter [Microbacterium sp. SSW1-59]MDZ8200081.1 LysE/ArgO family amino acid transporter [Microbacterium sp. SSW1-59]
MTFLAGLGLGLSLIIAIGAQNLFVLRQGLRRERVMLVATICTVSDAALITLGVSGVGALLTAIPWLVDAVRWTGALFLVGYGLLAARRVWRPRGEALRPPADETVPESPAVDHVHAAPRRPVTTRTRTRSIVLTTLALTWLNPHVYLDTVFLLGSIANTHGDQRWVFAAGAVLGSVLWFYGLAFGARFLSRWLTRPRVWRVLDGVFAAIMILLGVSLVLPH